MTALVTTEQLAAHLGVSTRQVQRLVDAGLPQVPVGARAVRYDSAACVAWLQANAGNLSCQSTARPKAATKSLSASAASAYTDACRRAQLRVKPSALKPN